MQRNISSVGQMNLISDRRRRRNQIQIKLAPQTLLNDFHMQQPQKAAAETKPERCRIFILIINAGVIELKLGQRVLQCLILA